MECLKVFVALQCFDQEVLKEALVEVAGVAGVPGVGDWWKGLQVVPGTMMMAVVMVIPA